MVTSTGTPSAGATIGRRALLGLGCASVVAVLGGRTAAAQPIRAEPGGFHAGRRLLGRSAKGRQIWVHDIGRTAARTTVLVLGSLHGNETAGIPIAQAAADQGPAHPDVRLVVVPTLNPDGDAARRRYNSRGVDLNRNFPGGRRGGRAGKGDYAGPKDLSEVESRLMHALVNDVRPDALVVFHQALNLVDPCGGSRALADRYGRDAGLRVRRLTAYPGSLATWLHRTDPRCTILTVELPARVDAAMRRRHLGALVDLQRGVQAL